MLFRSETSKQWTLGAVFSPTTWLSTSIDLWEIKRSNRIYELTPQQVVANYTTFPNNLVRGTDGRLDGPGGYIRAGFVNADGDITRGIDVSVRASTLAAGAKWTASLDGTYIDSFRSRVFSADKYTEYAGQWTTRDLYVRWKHSAKVSYERGPWSGTVGQQFTAGYKDELPYGPLPVNYSPNVKAYVIYNLSTSYSGLRNTVITAGVKNVFNTDPPFTAHNYDFVGGAGWDPRVADPRGRAYTLNVNYKFK